MDTQAPVMLFSSLLGLLLGVCIGIALGYVIWGDDEE